MLPMMPAKMISAPIDRKSTRLNSSHLVISYAVFCLKKKKKNDLTTKIITHQDKHTTNNIANTNPATRNSYIEPSNATVQYNRVRILTYAQLYIDHS